MSELDTIPTTNGRTTALAPRATAADILSDPTHFDHFKRVANMYSQSMLIPEHMRGKTADVMIAFAMARELGENPLIVMQSIYVVKGKAGWSATYMIARANRSGKFKGSIRWRETGSGEGLVVTAYAKLADTDEEISVNASMKMAIAENWVQNSKYKSMPEQMLRYRSATMLIRLYAPEVMLGRTDDEVYDIAGSVSEQDAAPTGSLNEIIDGEENANADPVLDQSASQLPPTERQDQPEKKSEPPNEIPDEMVSTPEAYQKAMESLAIEQKIDIEDFEKCLGLIRTSGVRVGASQLKVAMDARRQIITAARNGKLDWKKGRIVE